MRARVELLADLALKEFGLRVEIEWVSEKPSDGFFITFKKRPEDEIDTTGLLVEKEGN